MNGYYSEDCSLVCRSPNCLYGKCDRYTGYCTKCPTSKHGSLCDKACSVGCKDGVCDQLNGDCTHGCWPKFSGDKCCVKQGHCYQCTNTTHCGSCITGFYGQVCNMNCSEMCRDGCFKETGVCTLCNHGFFGPKCEHLCPDNCFVVGSLDICDFGTGSCLQGCVRGYYSANCSKTCSDRCADTTCRQDTGKCNGCVNGYHGITCDIECSDRCVNNTCTQDVGMCVHGCSDGVSGHDCSRGEDDSVSSIILPVGGATVGVLMIIVIVSVVLIYLRRRNPSREPVTQKEDTVPSTPTMNAAFEQDEANEDDTYENLDENRVDDTGVYTTPDV